MHGPLIVKFSNKRIHRNRPRSLLWAFARCAHIVWREAYINFRIMCDVPSIAVFCGESIKCFPSTASKFFLKLLVAIPVAPIITGTIIHFRFHIHCISIHKLLYFNSFFTSFCTTFQSACFATSISVHVFCFLFLIIISGLFAVTSLSVCTA